MQKISSWNIQEKESEVKIHLKHLFEILKLN